MRKTVSLITALVLVGAQLTACSTSKGFVNYSDYKKEMPIKAGPFDGEMLGTATGSKGGAIWDDCKIKANDAVEYMIANAKQMGGNAIGNVKWAEGGTSESTCKKGWGWVLLWPFLLTPLFMSSEVKGDVYKIKGGKGKSAGIYMLPKNMAEEKALIEKIVANM